MTSSAQFTVDEVSPSYWRVTFENGPVNLLDVDSIKQLARLVSRIEESATLTVVVFDSVNPDYFMAHWDLKADRARVASMAPGPTGLHPYLDNLVRLSKVPAVTISAIRGRVRGAGSEFVLATDIRFAGDKAILGHPEVGLGSVPGGGPMARLARLVGRGRAAEILLGADYIPADLAERHHAPGLARQHLAVLAHQHRDVRGAAVLAASRYRPELLRPRRRFPPGGGHGVPGGVRPRAA